MIVKAESVPAAPNGRKPYPIGDRIVEVKHFVVRVTMPDNPFGPHAHEQPELWYILDGKALVKLGEAEQEVGQGDLVVIDPNVEHGLRTHTQATWICLG